MASLIFWLAVSWQSLLISASISLVGLPSFPQVDSHGSINGHDQSNVNTAYGSILRSYNTTSSAGSIRKVEQQNGLEYFWGVDSSFSHKMPAVAGEYKVFRDVVKDYNAPIDGMTDAWPAIMNAIKDGSRCGANCQSTSTKGAIIYFPPGNYSISKPIIQYYYTSFIGHPKNKPQIVASPEFTGLAMIEANYYDPENNGESWWVNQNNFYRQIKHIDLNMRNMPYEVTGGPTVADLSNRPVGIHWQVSQACTIQNMDILMPLKPETTHIGIWQENGSGGFVSDIRFFGGDIGWAAGSQQYTAINLKFRSTKTAIRMLWTWGWNWKNIDVQNAQVAVDASQIDPEEIPNLQRHQGTGSLVITDSFFYNVDTLLKIPNSNEQQPAITIDNLKTEKVKIGVASVDGTVIEQNFGSRLWGYGWRFTENSPAGGNYTYGGYGFVPSKPKSLLDATGKVFTRSKPSYAGLGKEKFLDANAFGVKNDGDAGFANWNAFRLNTALQAAVQLNQILVLPAGIYVVDSTVIIPAGSRVVGHIWSQIMGIGPLFEDANNPKPVVKVGAQEGEQGVVEISDILITTRGNTAGAVLMEWNIHESTQGSAAMWDVIFRVGGAEGTDLLVANCPKTVPYKVGSKSCMAAAMMLHVKPKASIYVENTWLWVSDHDVDNAEFIYINVYTGRGVLIESKGPSWFHSVSNEHSTLYQWQLSGAENIYLGQIQSETPYFQSHQTIAELPYIPNQSYFKQDPTFNPCSSYGAGRNDTCREAWALRVIDSKHVYLYGGGFYSVFQRYSDWCSKFGHTCQDSLIDTSFSEEIWLFNLYTVGVKEVISPQGGKFAALDEEKFQNGFATSMQSWHLLGGPNKKGIGGTRAKKTN